MISVGEHEQTRARTTRKKMLGECFHEFAVRYRLIERAICLILFVTPRLVSLADDALPGGVTGTVYSYCDSLHNHWMPAFESLVLVEPSTEDSLPTPGEVTVTVYGTELSPAFQVALPGARLKLVSRSSRVQRIEASAEGGERLFSVALPMPGLEVVKQLTVPGLVSLYTTKGCTGEPASQILVAANLGWARTDSAGRFLIPGIPPSCKTVWAYHPSQGSITDSVCIAPGRATEVSLYLPFGAMHGLIR